jgi:hypothetical protein
MMLSLAELLFSEAQEPCRNSVNSTENQLSNPSGVLESQLVRIILRHYLRVGDLPIIVSHSFAALMLFVDLHTV